MHITAPLCILPRPKMAMALVALAYALIGHEAQAAIGGDCVGPPLPREFAHFVEADTPTLVADPEIKGGRKAQMPIGRSVDLQLTPLSRFRPVSPARFLASMWKNEPVAGGFVSLSIPKTGNYWIVSSGSLAAIELVPKGSTRPIDPSRSVLSIPCRIGLILQYRLKAGRYQMQYVSAYLDTALVELMPAGEISRIYAVEDMDWARSNPSNPSRP